MKGKIKVQKGVLCTAHFQGKKVTVFVEDTVVSNNLLVHTIKGYKSISVLQSH